MRVFVGMSGGVDSTVSALLCKSRGYKVTGVYMTNWTNCQREYQKVESICKRLEIECIHFNFIKEYWNFVFDPFLDALGHETPNPDIQCNQFIKFGAFYAKAKEMGADKIAFGHYCQTDGARLLKSVDRTKDQTYYLSQINSSVLKDVLFPVGGLWKHQVKALAQHYGFKEIAQQKESMGICFVGKQKFGSFIQEFKEQKQGDFVDEHGCVLGTFPGMSFYTIGQNARIPSQKKKYYVALKDFQKNQMVVVDDPRHPLLLKKSIEIDPHYISKPNGSRFDIKYRYRTPSAPGIMIDNKIEFDQPQQGLCIGQQVALYQGDVCIGGGKISSVL